MTTRRFDECDANDVKELNEKLSGLTVDVYGVLRDKDEHMVGSLAYDKYRQAWVLTTYVMYKHANLVLQSSN